MLQLFYVKSLTDNLTTDRIFIKILPSKNWLHFGSDSCLDPDPTRYVWRILQHCKIEHFPHFVSGKSEKWLDMHENFTRQERTRKSPLDLKSSGLWVPFMFTERMSVYISLAISRKNYGWDLHENFTRDVAVDNGELIEIWKSSTSGSRSRNIIFQRIL